VQPQPRFGPFLARLDGLLDANSRRPARERLTARRLFELLRAEGYPSAYDSVQRHVRNWRRARSQGPRCALDGQIHQSADGAPRVDLAVPAFGYKNHVGIDRRHRLIRRWTVTDAARHERGVRELIDTNNTASEAGNRS
jgi:hypothetical protein